MSYIHLVLHSQSDNHQCILYTQLYSLISIVQCCPRIQVSGHNLRADCQWHTLVPLLNCGANADLAKPALGLSRGMNGVTIPIVTLGTIRPGDSGAARNATEF